MAIVWKRNNIWYIRYKDENDRWQFKSCGKNATQADANFLARKYSSMELNRHHHAPVRIIKTGLEEAIVIFRDEVLPRGHRGNDKQESSISREKASVNNIISFLQNQSITKFETIDEDLVLEYLDSRKTEEISAKTRGEELRLFKKFFKWARKKNYCITNPTEEIKAPRPERKKPRYFLKDELTAIFNLAREPYLEIFRFLLYTGLRTGELCNLEWRDYNFEMRTLTIRVVAADRKNRTPGNKKKREETIPLNDSAHQILLQRKQAGQNEQFIFLNHGGNRLDDENVYRNLKPILQKLKISDASPHTFRHTFASHLVIMGVSIYVVRDLLRHASVRETEIYAHLSKESTRTAVLKLDELLDK